MMAVTIQIRIERERAREEVKSDFVCEAANLSQKGHFRVLFQAQIFRILSDQNQQQRSMIDDRDEE